MRNLSFSCLRTDIGKSAFALFALAALSATAHAQLTTLYSTGFEASEGFSTTLVQTYPLRNGQTLTTTPGALYGQPVTSPARYSFYNYGSAVESDLQASVVNAVNSTTVTNVFAASGTQAVRMVGAQQGQQGVQYDNGYSYVGTSNSLFRASLDLAVLDPSAVYGQWGLNLLNVGTGTTPGTVSINSLGAIGFVGGNVLASNDGVNIYAAIDLSTGQTYTANYGAFNNYGLLVDFGSQTLSGFFNNTQVGFVQLDSQFNPIAGTFSTTLALRPGTGNRIDSVTIGQALDSGAQDTAYFDNLRISGSNVSAVAAPEPSVLVLLAPVLPVAGFLLRRRKHN